MKTPNVDTRWIRGGLWTASPVPKEIFRKIVCEYTRGKFAGEPSFSLEEPASPHALDGWLGGFESTTIGL